MELSLEIKGYIQDALATKIYSWDKIKTFGKRIGEIQAFSMKNVKMIRTSQKEWHASILLKICQKIAVR